MKALRKVLAFTMAVLMIMSLCACSKEPSVPKTLQREWSYKADGQEYAIGVHLYSLYSAYNKAYSVVQNAKGDSFDAEASILDYSGTFDETGEVYTCSDWIKKEADKITRNLIALDQKVKEFGIEIDDVTLADYQAQAQKDWYMGADYDFYMQYYGYAIYPPYKDILEPFGISYESFYQSTYLAGAKQNAIYDYFYGKGGTKAVKDDELSKFFEDNYVSYSYFTVPLYEATQDEATLETVNVALSDKDIEAAKARLDSYVKTIGEGKSFDDIVKLYMAFTGDKTDPSSSNIENKENTTTSLGKEASELLMKLKDGESSYVIVGEENTQTAYFVYKKPIAKETKDYIAKEENYALVVRDMKGDEFTEYVESLADTVSPEKNAEAIDKYDLAIFEKKTETK